MTFSFTVLATDGAARRGRLVTARATVETPAFMPVGTLATVKTLRPEQVAALGYRLILANTYHLHLQPGEAIVARLGGVQQMMGWPGAILTDSGGYQVFSLSALREVDDDGVTFSTPRGPRRLTPELAMAIQQTLGSDIAMVLDDVPPMDASPEAQRSAMERTHRWALRSLAIPQRPDQARFAIVQGGANPEWRRESAAFLAAYPFDGFGIGGLSLGEAKPLTWTLTAAACSALPPDRPRYLMGVGAPDDLIRGVALGVDLFDSVLPTRLARHGAVFTRFGQLSLKGSRLAADPRPIDEGCDCLACQRYSRGWLRHLLMIGEPLGMRLATVHNLRFLSTLMHDLRRAIEEGRLAAFAASYPYGSVRRGDLPAA
ncbi:MAG: tRNA guanosine(34) transglycosylase Tgt [Chloroflexota bacterium]|nr:tRNA guanosine(34) transglycosylase Tgt [Dehalococcoidia bacterium]MDW8253781.1 tRNA guanosine(34) transglycosylase Tgt [Chloroflexota bacterium]